MRRRMHILASALVALATPAVARAAVTAAEGYAVRTIPTPDTVQGGVVRRAGAVLVGQGGFGGGLQSVVRLERAGATTIATGFNSLGGFDLAADGTLYVVDNCGECSGATTGDTLFAIPDALTRTTAATAAGLEVVPAGTIPAAQDVLLVPGAALVADAGGPGNGRVRRVTGGTATDLVTGLDFLGGLALFPDDTLRVANVDAAFAGAVLRYALDGTPAGTLAGGLSGAFAVVVDADQNVLVSGGFTDDFSSSTVLALAPDGTPAERARGFGYSSEMFFDAVLDETLVLDFGVSEVAVICRDTDADGACDCPAAANAKLTLGNLLTPPGDDTLALKGEATMPTAPVLDPGATGLRVEIADGAGTLLDAVVPAGTFDPDTGIGWKAKNGKYKYRNPAAILDITKVVVVVSATQPGRVKFVLGGKTGSFTVAPGDLPLRTRVELDPVNGQCADVRFPGPEPVPACVHNSAKGKVQCK